MDMINWFQNSILYEKLPNGELGSIVKYNSTYAITFAWLIPRRGSTFTLTESITILCVSAAIPYFMARYSCENIKNDNCVALPPAATSNLTLTTLCSVTIAIFSGLLLRRWWQLRVHLQACMGAGIELTLLTVNVLKTNIRNATSADEKKTLKDLYDKKMRHITGLIIATFHLLCNNAREEKDLSDLLKRGVISEDDHRYFMSINPGPVHAVAKIMDIIHESFRLGSFTNNHGTDQATNVVMHNSLLSLRQNMANVFLFVDVQVAYPFIQIIAAVVYCFLIQLFFVTAAFMSRGIATGDISDLITGFLTIILYNFVLLGLLRLFEILANPLGDDAADFPMYTYITRYEKTLNDLVKDGMTLINMEQDENDWPTFSPSSPRASRRDITAIDLSLEEKMALSNVVSTDSV